MSIAVTESLMFEFCTTDGGIVSVMQKHGSGIEIFSTGLETINRFGIGLKTLGDNNDRGDNKIGNNVWADTLIGLKPDQNPTRSTPKAVRKSSGSGAEAVQKRTLEVDVARPSLNELPTSTRQVLNAIADDCFMTQRGLVSKIGLAKSTIIKATAILIKNGYLRRVGPKKGVRWEVVG